MIVIPNASAAASRLYVSVWAGRSWSVAVAVNASVACSSTVLSPIAPSTGATFTSLTVIVIVSASVRFAGFVPLSVTVIVTV